MGDNSTNSQLEPTVRQINDQEAMVLLPVLIIYFITMFIGLIGNSFVLVVYKYRFKRSSARIFILYLAAIDLIVCAVGLPYHTLDLLNPYTYTFSKVCKSLTVLMQLFSLSSIFILIVVAIDRYFRICRPLGKQVLDFGPKRACAIAIFLAMLMAWPAGILYGHSSIEAADNITGVECFIDDDYKETEYVFGYLSLQFFIFIATIIFLIVNYSLICRKIYHHDKFHASFVTASSNALCRCRESSPDVRVETEVETIPRCDEAQEIIPLEPRNLSYKNHMPYASSESITSCDKKKETVVVFVKNEDRVDLTTHSRLQDRSKRWSDSSSSSSRSSCQEDRHPRCDSSVNWLKRNLYTPKGKSIGFKGRSFRVFKAGQPMKEKHTKKITMMMFTISIVFIISYLPFLAISVADSVDMEFWDGLSNAEIILYDFLLRTYLFNNMANPIIYGFWDHRFREECLKIITNLFRCTYESPISSTASNQ